MTIGTVVRSGGCWCMVLCARTLEEHHFITSKGLSLDLACHMYPCGLANLY